LVEVKVEAVLFDLTNSMPVVLLKDGEGKKFLPIWIGPFEASAIEMELGGNKPPRPMTHDLMRDIIKELKGEVTQVLIRDLEKNTYLATITINLNGRVIEVDARPSDAIALALRTKAKVFAVEWILKDTSLLGEAGKEGDKEGEKEKIKKFLENLRPEEDEYKQ